MHWSFNPVGGVWLVAAIAVGLLALAALRPGQALAPGRRWTLAALRVAAVLMLLFAMLRPEVVTTRVETLRAALLILIDSSKSMTVEDSLGDDSRWDAAVRLLDQSADSLQKLSRQADVELFQFDDTLRPIADLKRLDNLRPTGEATTLGRSMGELLDNEASERLLGVILLSDGAQRAPPDADLAPQVAARRFALEGTPIFPFSFGTPAGGARADVAIDDLVASESVFAGTPTQVSGQLRVRGYANQTLTVQLLWEDEAGEMVVVDTAKVPAGPAGGRFPVSLSYTPPKSVEGGLGEKKVELRVAPQDGEVLTSNNSQSTFVTVREGGVKVLYLAGAKRIGGGPGLEQRFIRASLASSPDIVVTRRLINYEPAQQNLAGELARDEFDVYVLDDLDAEAFDRQTWIELAKRVRDGAGLMMIGGYHSFGPGGHASSPLAAVLPVSPGVYERQRFDEPLRSDVHLDGPIKMRPAAPFGPRHPIMQIGPEPAKTWAVLPPLDGANRLPPSSLKPNASVLAEGDSNAAPPLLVAGQPGSGRALAFAGDSTWKWVMAGQGDAHRRFWRQAILWLAQKDDAKDNPVWLDLDARRVTRGAPLEIEVGANPPEGRARLPITLEAQVTRPDGAVEPINLAVSDNRGSGLYRLTDLPGDYTVSVTGTQDGGTLGTASARFVVPDNDLELDQPAAEPAVMAQLAQITADAGGLALAPEELPDLLAELAARDPRVQEEVVARLTYWDTWPFFLVLVGLLGVEWFLRKRWGMV